MCKVGKVGAAPLSLHHFVIAANFVISCSFPFKTSQRLTEQHCLCCVCGTIVISLCYCENCWLFLSWFPFPLICGTTIPILWDQALFEEVVRDVLKVQWM